MNLPCMDGWSSSYHHMMPRHTKCHGCDRSHANMRQTHRHVFCGGRSDNMVSDDIWSRSRSRFQLIVRVDNHPCFPYKASLLHLNRHVQHHRGCSEVTHVFMIQTLIDYSDLEQCEQLQLLRTLVARHWAGCIRMSKHACQEPDYHMGFLDHCLATVCLLDLHPLAATAVAVLLEGVHHGQQNCRVLPWPLGQTKSWTHLGPALDTASSCNEVKIGWDLMCMHKVAL